jgi:hypothetical protein
MIYTSQGETGRVLFVPGARLQGDGKGMTASRTAGDFGVSINIQVGLKKDARSGVYASGQICPRRTGKGADPSIYSDLRAAYRYIPRVPSAG